MGKLWEGLFRCLQFLMNYLSGGKKVMLYCAGVKVSLLSAMALSPQILSYSLPLLMLECVLQEPNECNRVGQIVGTP